MDSTAPGRHRVLIVGGGFAGLYAARSLRSDPEVIVTLLDRRNFHLFQPMLYQVATGALSPGEIAQPDADRGRLLAGRFHHISRKSQQRSDQSSPRGHSFGHIPAPLLHQAHRITEGQATRRVDRRIFTKAMACDGRRLESCRFQGLERGRAADQ